MSQNNRSRLWVACPQRIARGYDACGRLRLLQCDQRFGHRGACNNFLLTPAERAALSPEAEVSRSRKKKVQCFLAVILETGSL